MQVNSPAFRGLPESDPITRIRPSSALSGYPDSFFSNYPTAKPCFQTPPAAPPPILRLAIGHICFSNFVTSYVTPAMSSAILTTPGIVSSGAFFPFPLRSPPFFLPSGRRRSRSASHSTLKNPRFFRISVECRHGSPATAAFRKLGVSGDGDCIAHSGKHSQLDCGVCGGKLVALLQKPLALAVFGVAVGFFPFSVLRPPAFAAPAPAEVVTEGEIGMSRDDPGAAGHEYSGYTQKLLEKIPPLLRGIEDVKAGRGGLDDVKKALSEIKSTKERLQDEILQPLNDELSRWREEKEELESRSKQVYKLFWKASKELEGLRSQVEKENARVEELKSTMDKTDEEYSRLNEMLDEIEDRISRRETFCFSVGIRELAFIERESELLVERFSRRWKQQNMERCFLHYPFSKLVFFK